MKKVAAIVSRYKRLKRNRHTKVLRQQERLALSKTTNNPDVGKLSRTEKRSISRYKKRKNKRTYPFMKSDKERMLDVYKSLFGDTVKELR